MKLVFGLESTMAFYSGIWFHRNQTPSEALKKRGHAVRQIPLSAPGKKEILDWADTVIFGRTYPVQLNVVDFVYECKKKGKRVLYDMDDDFWQVARNNPSQYVSNAFKDQYEGMIKAADAITTPSKILAKKFRRFRKSVFICPNCTNPELYKERPHQRNELVVGYMGAASHWKDLHLITKALVELHKKHDFSFDIYGMTGEPLEAAMYYYEKTLQGNYQPEKNTYFQEALAFYDQMQSLKGRHYPFMPPELHPTVLSNCDFDIGLAPLQNTEFNQGKSDIKFKEYAAVGTVCMASDANPYTNSGVGYFAKPKWEDWYKKIERLIVDKKFREDLLKKQRDWIAKHGSLEIQGIAYELACQRPGGLKVLNQQI